MDLRRYLMDDLSNMSPKFYSSNDDRIMKEFSETGNLSSKFGGKFFFQRWQPFMYACILGIVNKKRVPLEDREYDTIKSGDVFKYQVVINNGNDILMAVILSIISLSEDGVKILNDPQKLNEEISFYANGGFEILNEKLDNGEISEITYFLKEVISRN